MVAFCRGFFEPHAALKKTLYYKDDFRGQLVNLSSSGFNANLLCDQMPLVLL